MAYFTNTAPVAWPLSFLARIGKGLESLFLSLAIAGSYDARMSEIEKLQSLSDEALAEKGLKRDEIVHYVYRDLFYI